MSEVKCPNCGTVIQVQEKKTGLWWGIGCLIAALALPVIVAIIGLLAAIAIPSFVRVRSESQRAACFANVRQLEQAKEKAALERGLQPGDSVPDAEIEAALGASLDSLRCPAGGAYSVQPVGEDVACSQHGASLSEGH